MIYYNSFREKSDKNTALNPVQTPPQDLNPKFFEVRTLFTNLELFYVEFNMQPEKCSQQKKKTHMK